MMARSGCCLNCQMMHLCLFLVSSISGRIPNISSGRFCHAFHHCSNCIVWYCFKLLCTESFFRKKLIIHLIINGMLFLKSGICFKAGLRLSLRATVSLDVPVTRFHYQCPTLAQRGQVHRNVLCSPQGLTAFLCFLMHVTQ